MVSGIHPSFLAKLSQKTTIVVTQRGEVEWRKGGVLLARGFRGGIYEIGTILIYDEEGRPYDWLHGQQALSIATHFAGEELARWLSAQKKEETEAVLTTS